MKKIIYFIIPALMLVMSSFSGCKPAENTPAELIKELPKMYLDGNLLSGEHAVIRSKTELLAIFPQTEIDKSPDLQEIDFNTQTLLIGRDECSHVRALNYTFSWTEKKQYIFEVNIDVLESGWGDWDYFLYGIVVAKLHAKAKITFIINKESCF